MGNTTTKKIGSAAALLLGPRLLVLDVLFEAVDTTRTRPVGAIVGAAGFWWGGHYASRRFRREADRVLAAVTKKQGA